MIPVQQTRFDKEGNCFQAVIASMLDLEIDRVPDFVNLYDNDFMIEANKWLVGKGLGLIAMTINNESERCILEDSYGYKGFYIGDLAQRCKPYNHVVIMRDNDIVHDPDQNSKHKEWKTIPHNAFFLVVDDFNKLREFCLNNEEEIK